MEYIISDKIDEGQDAPSQVEMGNPGEVQVVADCISSRELETKAVSLEKMGIAGISPTTTGMALFELLKIAREEKFKQISNIVK